MTIAGFLPLIVCVIGLVIWLILGPVPAPPNTNGHKGIVAEAGKIAYAAGLLAFLLGAGAITESCSTLDHSSSGGATTQHR